jgi:hypothetical protein
LKYGASAEAAERLYAAAHTGTLEQLQLCLTFCRDAEAAVHLRTSHGEAMLPPAEDNVEVLVRPKALNINATNANGNSGFRRPVLDAADGGLPNRRAGGFECDPGTLGRGGP